MKEHVESIVWNAFKVETCTEAWTKRATNPVDQHRLESTVVQENRNPKPETHRYRAMWGIWDTSMNSLITNQRLGSLRLQHWESSANGVAIFSFCQAVSDKTQLCSALTQASGLRTHCAILGHRAPSLLCYSKAHFWLKIYCQEPNCRPAVKRKSVGQTLQADESNLHFSRN